MATAQLIFDPQDLVIVQEEFLGRDVKRECKCYCVFNENVTGLAESDFTISTVFLGIQNYMITDPNEMAEIVGFDGENCCYELTIRLPDRIGTPADDGLGNPIYTNDDRGTITIALAQDAVDQTNPAVSETIDYCTNPFYRDQNNDLNIPTRYPTYDYHTTGADYDLSSVPQPVVHPIENMSFDVDRVYFYQRRDVAQTLFACAIGGGAAIQSENINLADANVGTQDDANGYLLNQKIYVKNRENAASFYRYDVAGNEIGQETGGRPPTTLHFEWGNYIFRTHDTQGVYLHDFKGINTSNEYDGGNFLIANSSASPDIIRLPWAAIAAFGENYGNYDTTLTDDNPRNAKYRIQREVVEIEYNNGIGNGEDGNGTRFPAIFSHTATSDRHYFLCLWGPNNGGTTRNSVLVADADLKIIPEECFVATHPIYTDFVNQPGQGILADTSSPFGAFVNGNKLVFVNRPIIGQTFQNPNPRTYVANHYYAYEYDLDKVKKPVVREQIYPQFFREGDTINLTDYCPGGETFLWDVGYDLPSFLSRSGNTITIGTVTEETLAQVKVKGINKIGSTDNDAFIIPIVIEHDAPPEWLDIQQISMEANTAIDLLDYVENANTVVRRNNRTNPTGSRVMNSRFTIAETGGRAYFTATGDGGSTHVEFDIDLVRQSDASEYSPYFRDYVEIAGINVTEDVLVFPEVSLDTDPIAVNEYRANNADVTLNYRNGFYDSKFPNNFWATNNLAMNGYLEPIKIYVESLVDGVWIRNILFNGLILEPLVDIDEDIITFNCVDRSYALQETLTEGVGIDKYDAPAESDTASFEGVYEVEQSLRPISQDTASGVTGARSLQIRKTRNAPEGIVRGDVAFVDGSTIRTQGGNLDEPPFVNFKTNYHHIHAENAINELAKVGKVYNPDISLVEPTLDDPHIQSLGNVAFNVSKTRIQHTPQDRLYDSTADTVYFLLSNASAYVSDMLVSYDMQTHRYGVVTTFPEGVKTVQLATSDFDTFYILTCGGITLDRSRDPLPRDTVSVISEYDAVLPGSDCKVMRYVVSTDTLTENFVPATNVRKPQVGLHYYAGFENAHTLDHYEGIYPENRSVFRIHNNLLYYRYASGNNFGVASVNASGTTTAVMTETKDAYKNHLNFAFDITPSGDVLMVYATGTETQSTLTAKQLSGGTVTTLHAHTQTLAQLDLLDAEQTDLTVPQGGAYLGCHELFYHDNDLFMSVPIQRVSEYQDDMGDKFLVRSESKSAGAVVYKLDLNDLTVGLQALERYDFVQMSGGRFVWYDSSVHFAESAAPIYKYKMVNKDADNYDAETNENPIPDDFLGWLKRIT